MILMVKEVPDSYYSLFGTPLNRREIKFKSDGSSAGQQAAGKYPGASQIYSGVVSDCIRVAAQPLDQSSF